ERIDSFRQHLDPERIDEAGRLERLLPPARALDQSASHRLRRAVVDVVDERFDYLRARGRRIDLLQTMARREAPFERRAERHGEIEEADREVPHPRIELARLEPRVR